MKIMSGRKGLFACEVMVVLLVAAGEDEGMQIKIIILIKLCNCNYNAKYNVCLLYITHDQEEKKRHLSLILVRTGKLVSAFCAGFPANPEVGLCSTVTLNASTDIFNHFYSPVQFFFK